MGAFLRYFDQRERFILVSVAAHLMVLASFGLAREVSLGNGSTINPYELVVLSRPPNDASALPPGPRPPKANPASSPSKAVRTAPRTTVSSIQTADSDALPPTRFSLASGDFSHPYFSGIWRRVTRASRDFGRHLSPDAEFRVRMHIDKSGKILGIQVNQASGQNAQHVRNEIEARLKRLGQFQPIPDDIAGNDIDLSFLLRVAS